ncbi:hypothetical protein O181_022515 [Austropuccinia psidii MF-1]|uniref:Uncharacterized protein n=1 Tax=Austropuccinia psidii MF-1 TaxID=1389203 RepID=A0A9Q3GY56_9BASI|nr:hypothetical protein [Austropuccinia psidii MF-1]
MRQVGNRLEMIKGGKKYSHSKQILSTRKLTEESKTRCFEKSNAVLLIRSLVSYAYDTIKRWASGNEKSSSQDKRKPCKFLSFFPLHTNNLKKPTSREMRYYINYWIFLAEFFLKTFGLPSLLYHPDELSERKLIKLDQNIESYWHNSNLHQESAPRIPTIRVLNHDIIELFQQTVQRFGQRNPNIGGFLDQDDIILQIQNKDFLRETRETTQMYHDYETIKGFVNSINERKEDLKKFKAASDGIDVDSNVYMLIKAFQNIQVLIRNRLTASTGLNPRVAVVADLAHLESALAAKTRKFWFYDAARWDTFEIGNKVLEDLTDNLSQALNSMRFLAATASPSGHHSRVIKFQVERLGIKMPFEQCIFELIDFMYKYKISAQNHLQRFFWNDQNIKITANHVKEIYEMSSYGESGKQWFFLPKMTFIINDWKIKHLHNLLGALSPKQEAIFVYDMLIWFADNVLDIQGHEDIGYIQQVSTLIRQMISVVDAPPRKDEEVEYLALYCILHFANKYPTTPEANLVVQEFARMPILQQKYLLMEMGQLLHVSCEDLHDMATHLAKLGRDKIFKHGSVDDDIAAFATKISLSAVHYQTRRIPFEADRNLQTWMKENH